MLAWTQHLDGAAGRTSAAFTDRVGGYSSGPYGGPAGGGLNLATHVGDDPADVAANRRLVADAVGLRPERLVVADQVHGGDVVQVDGPLPVPASADAMVTTALDLALVVLVADCVPVLLADPEAGVVGVAHAGRPGMATGVVSAVVAAMRDLRARAPVAWLGPSVCPRCYPVPLALREQVAAVAPVSRSVSWDGTPALDVAAGVLDQLAALGVTARQLSGCTVESDALYSYRRDGQTGRCAGLVWRPGQGGW